ncbi:MAG: hypothetical protein SBU_001087 [Candidatus Syntrophoarchaeum butanivorans]|uniref:Uncharacterized protein n=1 Tax=Candidatus Syntropharchaeum butanivorans TaxID=1839936 RepID=A0A1F2P453_9EURY|nr:MAG: hypothetical protein SBU_001087 [Candidatus Syntrophoarchaeum butanivorans]
MPCNSQTRALTHGDILKAFRKGLRNGNWRRLSKRERALYMASLWYARVQGMIVNGLIVSKLMVLIDRLTETIGKRIFMRGFEKAIEILDKYGEYGVFSWAPSMKKWLKDPDYIFWLGRSE